MVRKTDILALLHSEKQNTNFDCIFGHSHPKSSLTLSLSLWAISLGCSNMECNRKNSFWYPLTQKKFSDLFCPLLSTELDWENFLKKATLQDPARFLNWQIEEYNEPVVREYFPLFSKWHIESSAMCTQKTIQWLHLIKNWSRKNFSYCIIGPRISFVTNTHSRLETYLKEEKIPLSFYLYHTSAFYTFLDTSNSASKAPNVLITYESLWKISHFQFDVIIIDEITTVLTCITSPTNKHYLQLNSATFHKFLMNAKHVLLLDADLNTKCLDLVSTFQNPLTEKVLFRINKYKNPNLKKTVLFYTDRPKKFSFKNNLFSLPQAKQKKKKFDMKENINLLQH